MPDERGMIIGDQAEVRFDRLDQGMARMEGRFEQMDKRLSNVEAGINDLRKDIRQVLFVVIVSIAVPILLEIAKRMIH